MTNHPNRKHAVRFLVMDAPGWYGDYALIYSTHRTLEAARRAAKGHKNLMISTDGGFRQNNSKGCRIHREFAARYERVY